MASSSIPSTLAAPARASTRQHYQCKNDVGLANSNSNSTNPNPVNQNQTRKRKRLNAVLDKISNHLNARNQNISVVTGEEEEEEDTGNNNNFSSSNGLDNRRRVMDRHQQPSDHLYRSPLEGTEPKLEMRSPLSSAALRRERWRDSQQQSVEEQMVLRGPISMLQKTPIAGQSLGEVFKFDSFDRERYQSGGSGSGTTSKEDTPISSSHLLTASSIGESENLEADIISPLSGRSPHSSLSSPQVSVDSPRICFSPLRIKDSIEEEEDGGVVMHNLPKLSVRGCDTKEGYAIAPPGASKLSATSTSGHWLEPMPSTTIQSKLLLSTGYPTASQSRPVSPNLAVIPTTPISSSPTTPFQALRHMPIYLTDVYKRRCLSDTDLSSSWDELTRGRIVRNTPHAPPLATTTSATSVSGRYLVLPGKGGSLESEASSCTSASTAAQESPLDLSLRSSISSSPGFVSRAGSMDNLPQPTRGRGRSHAPRARAKGRGASSMDRISLDRLDVSPVVENVPGSSSDVAFVCPICGQMFSLSDRLAKHMASRHKSRSTDSGTKAYTCDVCKRSFARSDMLTRHMRLHTGVKPYTCRVCGQVFSRSDHLSTHQRTHTGEKPYRCPSCPYAACRRDMITRHMRTHARYELQDTSAAGSVDSESRPSSRQSPASGLVMSRSISSESAEPTPPTLSLEKPPSPMDTDPSRSKHP